MYYLQCKSIDTFEALKDDCLLNIFVQSLPNEVAEFVKSRAVKTAVEAAVAADLCYSVQSKDGAPRRRQMSQGTNWPKQPGGKPVTSQGDSAGDSASVATSNAAVKNVRKEQVKARGCWSCGSLGHKQTDCPDAKHSNMKKGKQNDRAQDNAFVMSPHKTESENRFVIPCYVQGRDGLITAYRDSGASISLLTADIVDKHDYTGEKIAVRGAFGPEIKIPTARVRIKAPKFRYDEFVTLIVGVVDGKLPYDVDMLIGNSLFTENPHVYDIICVDASLNADDSVTLNQFQEAECSAIVTRSQSKFVETAGESARARVREVDDSEVPTDRATGVCPRTTAQKRMTHNEAIDCRLFDDNLMVNGVKSSSEFRTGETGVAFHAPSSGKRPSDEGGKETASINADASIDGVQSLPSPLLNSCGTAIAKMQAADHNTGSASVTRLKSDNASADRTVNAEVESHDEFLRLSAVDPAVINNDYFVQPTAKQVELANMQASDPTLQKAWTKARLGKGGFVIRNGVLFKMKPQHIISDQSDENFLLVLPECYKKQVLIRAHDSMTTGGHTGFQRTARKILKTFYMPRREIKRYCASCLTCQRMRPKTVNERADYQIPLIDTDFGQTFVIDVMGGQMNQLSRRYGNYRYVLVCVETATRWVELA